MSHVLVICHRKQKCLTHARRLSVKTCDKGGQQLSNRLRRADGMAQGTEGQQRPGRCYIKKEIKTSFLKDVFQTADEIKQSQEKLKDAVDASSRQAAALIRPYLSEVQNETLSEILERLVASVAEHSFQIGYSSAMQTFAEAAAALEAKSYVQQ